MELIPTCHYGCGALGTIFYWSSQSEILKILFLCSFEKQLLYNNRPWRMTKRTWEIWEALPSRHSGISWPYDVIRKNRVLDSCSKGLCKSYFYLEILPLRYFYVSYYLYYQTEVRRLACWDKYMLPCNAKELVLCIYKGHNSINWT